MLKLTISTLLCICATISLSGCSVSSYTKSSTAPSTNPNSVAQKIGQSARLQLADGQQVTVIGATRVTFANGDPPALQITYISDLPISENSIALQKEANLVWDLFRKQVEQAGERTGLVTARSRLPFDNNKYKNYTLGWRQNAKGVWQPLRKK